MVSGKKEVRKERRKLVKNLRDKTVASQPKARKKVQLSVNVEQRDYQKKPEKVSDQLTEVKKQEVMEENDYAGVRSIDDKHNVTEKGESKMNKKKA